MTQTLIDWRGFAGNIVDLMLIIIVAVDSVAPNGDTESTAAVLTQVVTSLLGPGTARVKIFLLPLLQLYKVLFNLKKLDVFFLFSSRNNTHAVVFWEEIEFTPTDSNNNH